MNDLVPLQLMHASPPGMWIASATLTVLIVLSFAPLLEPLAKTLGEFVVGLAVVMGAAAAVGLCCAVLVLIPVVVALVYVVVVIVRSCFAE